MYIRLSVGIYSNFSPLIRLFRNWHFGLALSLLISALKFCTDANCPNLPHLKEHNLLFGILNCSIRQEGIRKYYVLLTVHLDIPIQRKTNLIYNLSSIYFVKHLYMFRPYLQPIIRWYTVWIQILVFIVLFRYLSVVVAGLQPIHDNRHSI